jgi:hypothetical protein
MTYRQLWEIWSQCVLQEIQYKKQRLKKYKPTYHYMYNFVNFSVHHVQLKKELISMKKVQKINLHDRLCCNYVSHVFTK